MTIQEYIAAVPEDKAAFFERLRGKIMENLPAGFEEVMNYGMIGYVVPHSLYPAGYHCNPKDPLPFMGLASQKLSITFYHMGLYADEELTDWFVREYSKTARHKIDMGKSCIRFKYYEEIPFELIGELVKKISTESWIRIYDSRLKR